MRMTKMKALSASAILLALALSGCSSNGQPQGDSSPAVSPSVNDTAAAPKPTIEAEESATEAEKADGPTVPGMAYGQMPDIPLFEIPDLGLIEQSIKGVTKDLTKELASYPGLKVSAARCDDSGVVISGEGSAVLYGGGGGVFQGTDHSVIDAGDGSGTYELNGQSVVVGGDGSGVFTSGDLSVTNAGDGSGTYNDGNISLVIDGSGGGTYTAGDVSIVNAGDGSGTYTDKDQSITNAGDGSGVYTGYGIDIVNSGDGTGLVNGTTVDMEPLDKVAKLGKFPPMGAMKPVKGCGTVISLESGVLFDVDKYEIRDDAEATLKSVAKALNDVDAGKVKVQGHTDSVRDEAWNQTLSEDRAEAVVDQLKKLGSTADLEGEGFGESRPIANNDTAAGRQLNRRVEIFIPTT